MNARVLFVDDEPSVLNGIRRRLDGVYEIATADSGEAGLELIDSSGPYAVIVTDMRMPQMNGVQFIQHARMVAPDSAYIMLTGNQDQATAIKALNDGQVFRFLNKPCDHSELCRAIDAGLKQFEAVAQDRDLLQRTFAGAVGVLNEVLELSQPELFTQSARIEQLLACLRRAAGASDRWEYKVAARLSLLGMALMSGNERATLQSSLPASPDARELDQKSAEIGAKLVEKVPRLEPLAAILRAQKDADGALPPNLGARKVDFVPVVATLLRAASLWNRLMRLGLGDRDATTAVMEAMPALPEAFPAALVELGLKEEDQEAMWLQVHELAPGMVLAADVLTKRDARLLQKGHRLTPATLEKLQITYAEDMESVRVAVRPTFGLVTTFS